MNEFLLILGMALATFIVRYPVIVLVGKIPLPKSVFKALRYVPAAVLAAIIVPGVLMPNGDNIIDFSPSNAYLVAGIISVLVAWRTKNVLITILVGMGLFLFIRLVLNGG